MLTAKNPTQRRPKSPLKTNRRENLTKPRKNFLNDDQSAHNESDLGPQNFSSASTILEQLVGMDEVSHLLDPNMRRNSRMVYSKGVTIWMLILQRLCKGATLEQTVSHVLQHDRHLFPENRRTEEFTLSANPSSYSAARGRLDIDELREFSHRVCDSFAQRSDPTGERQRFF